VVGDLAITFGPWRFRPVDQLLTLQTQCSGASFRHLPFPVFSGRDGSRSLFRSPLRQLCEVSPSSRSRSSFTSLLVGLTPDRFLSPPEGHPPVFHRKAQFFSPDSSVTLLAPLRVTIGFIHHPIGRGFLFLQLRLFPFLKRNRRIPSFCKFVRFLRGTATYA